MARKIIFSDDYTEISITNVRGRIIRHYSDTPDEMCYVTIDEAKEIADHCRALDADPIAMSSHVYTRYYVKQMNER